MNAMADKQLSTDLGQTSDHGEENEIYKSIPDDKKVLFEKSAVLAVLCYPSDEDALPRLIRRFDEPVPLSTACQWIERNVPRNTDGIVLLLEDATIIYTWNYKYAYFYNDFYNNDIREQSCGHFINVVLYARDSARETSSCPHTFRSSAMPWLRERLMVPYKGMFWFDGDALLALPSDLAYTEPAPSVAKKLERYGIAQVLELSPKGSPSAVEESWIESLLQNLEKLMNSHGVSLQMTRRKVPLAALLSEEALDAFLVDVFAATKAGERTLVIVPANVLSIIDNYSRRTGRNWINKLGWDRSCKFTYITMGSRRIVNGEDDWLIDEYNKHRLKTSLFNTIRSTLSEEMANSRIKYSYFNTGGIGITIPHNHYFDSPVSLFTASAWMEPLRTALGRSMGFVFEDDTVLSLGDWYFKDDDHWKGIEFLKAVHRIRLVGKKRSERES